MSVQPVAVAAARALTPAVADAVTALVNERYAATEGSLWHPGKQRTDVEEIARVAAEGRLVVASDPADGRLLGAVVLYLPDTAAELHAAGVAEFGMLAVSPAAAGAGIGTALVRAVEALARERGARTMDLEVLRPEIGTLDAKERLAQWYPRLGYRLVDSTPALHARPDLSAVLAVPCVVDRYRRSLQ